MANKKYTLYFKGKNKYGHEYNYPIIALHLKEMDSYTVKYKDYEHLFKSLPNEVLNFIKNELCFEIDLDNDSNLEKMFFITDNDFTPIMDVIFKKDMDVLCISPKELENLMIQKLMTLEEFQKSLLKTKSSFELKNRYDFFEYLYNTYVKNEPIEGMIDDYDVKKYASNLSKDDIMIASIATDKNNLIVLSKKLSQTLESRRNLALKFKKNFIEFGNIENILENNKIDVDYILNQMSANLNNFKKNYIKEYE